MYTYRELSKSLQGRINELGEVAGRKRWVHEIQESVGLRQHDEATDSLIECADENGNRCLGKNRVKAQNFSFVEIAEAIGGIEFRNSFDPGANGRSDSLELLEAGPGVDPTAFLNINTFSAAVGGLIEAAVLENFENPAHIGDELFDTMPTRKNGEKMIGTYGFDSEDGDGTRKPGLPHPRAQFGERWVSTPELEEKALACEVTQETVFYDLTNEVLQRAAGVGEILSYGREKTMLKLFVGATNSYVYNGTSYDTYQASTPWINTHTNVASDYSDIDAALALFENMTDPETGREIVIMPDTIVHMPRRRSLWHRILNSTETREVTNTNTTTISTPPPSTTSQYRTLDSTILRNIIVNDLSESTADATEYWFIGQPKKCFKWMEAWPLRVSQVSPNEYGMKDRGLVAAYFANYRGVGAVAEPRYMVRNIADT